jgi:hypothetical protein
MHAWLPPHILTPWNASQMRDFCTHHSSSLQPYIPQRIPRGILCMGSFILQLAPSFTPTRICLNSPSLLITLLYTAHQSCICSQQSRRYSTLSTAPYMSKWQKSKRLPHVYNTYKADKTSIVELESICYILYSNVGLSIILLRNQIPDGYQIRSWTVFPLPLWDPTNKFEQNEYIDLAIILCVLDFSNSP